MKNVSKEVVQPLAKCRSCFPFLVFPMKNRERVMLAANIRASESASGGSSESCHQ
jgi:hypothetical protein